MYTHTRRTYTCKRKVTGNGNDGAQQCSCHGFSVDIWHLSSQVISLPCLKWNWMKSLLNPHPGPHLRSSELECLRGEFRNLYFWSTLSKSMFEWCCVMNQNQWTGSPLFSSPTCHQPWSNYRPGDAEPNVIASKSRMSREIYVLVHANDQALEI